MNFFKIKPNLYFLKFNQLNPLIISETFSTKKEEAEKLNGKKFSPSIHH